MGVGSRRVGGVCVWGGISFFLHFHFTKELVTTRFDTAVRTSKSEHYVHTRPPEINQHVGVRLLQPGGAVE